MQTTQPLRVKGHVGYLVVPVREKEKEEKLF